MENQQEILDRAVKISVIAGVLIVALSLAYYLVVFLPQKEEVRIEQQKQEQAAKEQQEKEREDKLNACLDKEKQRASISMEGLARLKREGGDFDLETSLNNAEKDYQIKKADCFKKYPQ